MNQLNRKLISFLMLLMLSMTAQANIDSTLSSIKDNIGDLIATTKANADTLVNEVDTSAISKQVYSDVKSALIGMAGALKVGAEHVYGVLVRQQVVYSVIYLLLLIFGFILMNVWVHKYKSDEIWINNYDEPTFLGIFRIFQLIAGFILFIIGLFHTDLIVSGIINPEYGAIKEILDLVKK